MTNARYGVAGIVAATALILAVACVRVIQPEASPPTPLPTIPATITPRPTATLRPTLLPSPTATERPPSATPVPPTATDTPALPTATPTQTGLEDPEPTAPPMSERLAQAQRLMHNGDYAAAESVYQGILAAPLTAAEADEARYGLGMAALRAGDYAAAIAAFTDFLNRAPQGDRAADAWFLMGEARQGAGDPAGAIAAYRNYLATAAVADAAPYAQERIGDAYLALNAPGQAAAAYETALAQASADQALRLHEKAGQAYAAAGNTAQAIAHYEVNLGLTTNATYRAKMLFLAGQTLLNAGQAEAGYNRFLTLVNTYPATADAYQALIALVNAGVPVDDYQRGLVDVYAGAYTPAVEALNRYIASGREEHRADAFFFLARAQAGLGNTAEALAALDTLLNTYPASARWGDAWLEKARIQAGANDVSAALATYRAFVDQAPNHPQAPEALWRAGLLADSNGDTATAGALFRELADHYPNHERASEGLWRAAFSAYRQGDVGTATEFWRSLAARAAGERSAAAALWLGQVAQRQGDPQAAAQYFARAQQLAPDNYYALRAAELTEGIGRAFSRPVTLNPNIDLAAEQAEAERWLAARLQLSRSSGLGRLSPQIAADPRLRRGQALWQLGLYPEAKVELENLRRAYARDALASYQLALTFRDLGLYRSSILAATATVRLAGASATTAPRFLGRLMYPIYYADLIVPEAQKYGLDPLLMFALVRQESLFEAIGTSYAQAQGLMQVIPPTGAWIAEQLRWPNYQNQDLYRPYVNIIFGTYYLAVQRNRFEGDLYAALAAYNAGPGRSAIWRQQANGDQDLFLELITLEQPQTYIKRIAEHYAIYRILYGQ